MHPGPSKGKPLLQECDVEAQHFVSPTPDSHVEGSKELEEIPLLPEPVWSAKEEACMAETFEFDKKKVTDHFTAKDKCCLVTTGVLTCTWMFTPCYLSCATKNGKAQSDALNVSLTPEQLVYVAKKKTSRLTACWNWRNKEVSKVTIPLEQVEKVVTVPKTGKGCFVKSTLDKVLIYQRKKPKAKGKVPPVMVRGLTDGKAFQERVNAMMQMKSVKGKPNQLTM